MSKPTYIQVRELLKRHKLTSAKAGQIINVDSRTIRRYTSNPDAVKGAKPIPTAAWYLLNIVLGEMTLEQARTELL